jgi:hypothetical protein
LRPSLDVFGQGGNTPGEGFEALANVGAGKDTIDVVVVATGSE